MTRYRVIEGFPLNRVGDDGSFWTRAVMGKAAPGSTRALGPWRARKTTPRAKDGYVLVRLRNGAQQRVTGLHVLVLEAFGGPRPPGQLCRHLDDDPTNNRATNLAWGSGGDNSRDRERNGRSYSGTGNPNARLSAADLATVVAARGQIGARSLATRFKVHRSTIYRVWREARV